MDTKLDLRIAHWWSQLSDEEQNVLINLLHKLNLVEYVEMDKDGNILKLKNET